MKSYILCERYHFSLCYFLVCFLSVLGYRLIHDAREILVRLFSLSSIAFLLKAGVALFHMTTVAGPCKSQMGQYTKVASIIW